MVSAPTNGELAFAIVLPLSTSNADSSTTPVLATTDEGNLIGHAGTWHVPRNELVFHDQQTLLGTMVHDRSPCSARSGILATGVEEGMGGRGPGELRPA